MIPCTVVICVASAWPLIFAAVFVHELGHAAFALAKTSALVTIRIGAPRGARQLQIGRLRVVISLHRLAGMCHFAGDQLSPAGHVLHLLAGPVANLAFASMLLIGGIDSSASIGALFITASCINFITGFAELVPYRSFGKVYPGLPSDGLQAWCLLRGRPVPHWRPQPASGTRPAMSAALAERQRIAESSVPPPSHRPQSSR